MPESSGLIEALTATNAGRLSKLTPAPTASSVPAKPTEALTSDARNLEPGFTPTETPLPEGFPILPGARFVAYNPAFDLCAQRGLLCPVRQSPPQVWLFEIDLPADPEATIRVIASQYVSLLKSAGYQIETTLADDATLLNFTGPAGSPVRRGSIVIGPQVGGRTFPASTRVIGLRIVIEQN